jgi:UDP-N-acetylmuramate dehydrogenase
MMNSEKNINGLQKDVLLSNHTTFRIGGPAKFFCAVQNRKDLVGAIKWAKENKMPFFILGGGSNLLVSDEGYNGLVMKIQNSKFKIQNSKVICEAGVPFSKIILETAKRGYSGVEWGFGIPGTIGGAICGNAGRLGEDISQIVESVEVLDENFETKTLTKAGCEFGYRESRFKNSGEIILQASLIFTKKDQAAIEKVLNEAKEVVKKSPPFPSAGCAFKNYKLKEDDSLLKFHPELESQVRGGKIGVGFLIDQCGLKGKQIGGAKIWEGHANYIVNVGGAKAKDVLELIDLCRKSVKQRYNIELEEEIRIIGY